MTQDEAKLLVAKRAVEFVEDGMRVGLGTGTTATLFIRELGERVRQGLKIRCVASSDASQELGASLGMEVVTLAELPELDVYIDGADEVGPGLSLIKGGGGALLREKIVASAAREFIVVVDSTKRVERLGRFPLPVEVVKMALPVVEPRLAALGLRPMLRRAKLGDTPFLTDEGNYILDCACEPIEEPEELAAEIRGIVGVVEHGLFLGMASLALVAGGRWGYGVAGIVGASVVLESLKIETIFFDIGGVLLTNGWDEGQRAAVLPRFGVDLAAYEARHGAANWHWERGLQDARWFFDQTVFHEPRTFSFEELWAEVEGQSALKFPETFAVLRELRAAGHYKIATLNNESRELNEYRLRAFGLREHFDYFVCSGYVGEMKPNPAIYRAALEVSGTPAGATVFIDDKEENCVAARAMGMRAVRFTSAKALREELTRMGVELGEAGPSLR